MPRGGARLRVKGNTELRDLSRSLRAVGETGLNRAMKKRIRDAADIVADEVRQAALRIPDTSPARRRDGESLRRKIANAVQVRATANGVRLSVVGRLMPPDASGMAHAFENPRGWRHPVFGNRSQSRDDWTWVQQRGRPWFGPTIRANEPRFRAEVRKIIDDVRQETGL